MASKVEVEITGKNAGLISALNQSKEKVAEASEQMKASFEKVAAAAELINTAMIAVTAVLAGGAAFKEAIAASAGAAYASYELGRQLGITANQASALKVAMDENFVSTESVSSASDKIAKNLKTNEQAFFNLGISTRDANGNFRNTFDIMQEVNAKLLTFKEGTDRNVEGMKIYGRSWTQVMDIVKITGAVMEESRAKADALGLTVGQEGVAQALAYKHSVADVHTVFEALQKVIGDALLPALTRLGQWFSSVGPQAVAMMRAAVYTLYATFNILKEGITVATDWIAGKIEVAGAYLTRFASTADRALHADFAGAKAAWAAGTADIEAKSKFMSDTIVADMKAAADARDKFFDSQGAQQTEAPKQGGAASSGQDPVQLSMLEAAFEKAKSAWQANQASEGSFREYSKEQEVEYWKNILATTQLNGALKVDIEKKIAVAQQAAQKSAFMDDLANLKTQESEHKNNMAARLEIEQQYLAKIKTAYGEDSKEYAAAQKTIIETKRAAVEQQRQIDDIHTKSARNAALTDVSLAMQSAKQQYDLHTISLQQLLGIEQQYEQKKYDIKRQAVQDELALVSDREDPVKFAELNAQLEAAEQEHVNAMAKINAEGAKETTGYYKQFYSSMESGFQSSIAGMLNGTKTLAQGIRGLFQSVLSSIVGVLASIAAKWLANAVMERLISKTTAAGQIAANAGVAATAAMASVAAIPFYGWAMAPGVGAATFGDAMAYQGSLASAAGGWDIPSGLNPMTQLHSREMVLPAPIADKVRGMTSVGESDAGFGRGGDSGPVNVSFPGKDLGNHFLMHKEDLQVAIRTLIRDGGMG